MSRRYKPEVHEYIKEIAPKHTIQEVVDLTNDKFGLDFTYMMMKSYFTNHKLHSLPRKGRVEPNRRRVWPLEMEQFVIEHHKGLGHQAMADLLNETFGASYTKEQVKVFYGRLGLNSGLTGRFVKGQVSFNKGLKQEDFMSPEAIERTKRTRFKKGHIPHNGGTPVGTIRLRRDHPSRGGRSYLYIKTAEPNVWKLYHRVVWEEHNGPVPDGYMVTFADGDHENCDISNLILESKAQHAIKNQMKVRSYNRESAEALNLLADLKMAATKRRKQK